MCMLFFFITLNVLSYLQFCVNFMRNGNKCQATDHFMLSPSNFISFQGRLVDFKEKKRKTLFVILIGPQGMLCWAMMLQVLVINTW